MKNLIQELERIDDELYYMKERTEELRNRLRDLINEHEEENAEAEQEYKNELILTLNAFRIKEININPNEETKFEVEEDFKNNTLFFETHQQARLYLIQKQKEILNTRKLTESERRLFNQIEVKKTTRKI